MVATHEQETATAVSIAQLSARKSQQAVRGIFGSKNQIVRDKSMQVQRTNGEAFYALLTDVFGWQQFCSERHIPHDAAALSLIDQAGLELELSADFQQETLSKLDVTQCAPALMYTPQREEGVWARLREIAPDLYEATCPATTKRMVQRTADEKAQKQERYANSPKPQAESKFVPAPQTAETQDIIAFRNRLTASKLRTWKTIVSVLEPFDTDKLGRIGDFIAKFQHHGYEVDDRTLREVGGLAAEMQSRLGRLRAIYEADLTAASALLIPALEAALDVGVVTFPRLNAELHLSGAVGNFIVSHGETPVLTVRDGVMQANHVPASVMAVIAQANYVLTASLSTPV